MQNRLKLPSEMTEYSSDRTIHKIISTLLIKDNSHQDSYLRSILKKSNGTALLDQAILALRDLQQKKHQQIWDSHTLGELVGVLEFCGLPGEDPEGFLKSLKEGETVTSRIMGVIQADPNLMYDLDRDPYLKSKVNERIQFIDDQFEDVKTIDELIHRMEALKTVSADKKKSAKPSLFSKFNIFKKDRDGHDDNVQPTLKRQHP